MAALSIVAASVRPNNLSSRPKTVTSGAAVTQGQVVRLQDNKYYPASNDTESNAEVKGVAVSVATAADQLLQILEFGTEIFVGVGVTKGLQYYLGASGSIVPVADVTSGKFVSTVGIGGANQNLHLNLFASGESVP